VISVVKQLNTQTHINVCCDFVLCHAVSCLKMCFAKTGFVLVRRLASYIKDSG